MRQTLLTGLVFAMLAAPAYPQTAPCGPRDDMVAMLTGQFGEVRMSAALDQRSFLIEVYANEATGTWTALLTTPDMEACIAAYGTGYETVHEAPGVDG